MAARRCNHCDRNHELDTFTCPSCGGNLAYTLNHNPDALPDDPVERWRLEQLVRAGYPADTALQLAAQERDVDLHQAVQLLENGCDAQLAGRILL